MTSPTEGAATQATQATQATLPVSSPDRAPGLPRRTVLAGTGATCALLLAACGSSSSGGSPAGSTTGGSPPSGGGSGGSGGSGTAVATLSDITIGSAVPAKGPDGGPIVVARPTASTAVAFSAICTHMGCTVAPAGKELDCPCHGSRFAATTGKVLGGPAPSPLPSIPVTVRGGQVFLA